MMKFDAGDTICRWFDVQSIKSLQCYGRTSTDFVCPLLKVAYRIGASRSLRKLTLSSRSNPHVNKITSVLVCSSSVYFPMRLNKTCVISRSKKSIFTSSLRFVRDAV